MSYEEALELIEQCSNRAPLHLDTEADLERLKDFMREKMIEEPCRLLAEHELRETISRLEDELLESGMALRDLEDRLALSGDEVCSLRSEIESLRASLESFSGRSCEN